MRIFAGKPRDLYVLIVIDVVVAVAILLLAACGPTASAIEGYQQRTVDRCGFRPSADTIKKILAVKNEVLSDPDTLALAICKAVGNTPLPKG